MKKSIAFVLVLAFVCLMMYGCMGSKASPIEDFEYELEDGVAIITGYIGTDLEIVVPSEIEGRPVTTIDDKAFKGYDMTKLVIPEGVLEVEGDALKGCEMLEKISLPKSLVYFSGQRSSYVDDIMGNRYYDYECYLEDSEWYENQPDNKLVYLDSVLIGFKGEIVPDKIEIKNGTTLISSSAFENLEDVKEVVIPKSVVSICHEAFCGTNITELHIPDSVKYIGSPDLDSDSEDAIGNVITDRDVVIYGERGSVAEEYAEAFNLEFVAE